MSPAPDTIRQQLGAAQRELDALRSELDTRLSALEAALARPDSHPALEDLIMALARVATAEAEAAAARASLAARAEAQEAAANAAAELQRRLDAERETVGRLQRELDAERERAASAARDHDATHDREAHGAGHQADEAAHRAAIEKLEQRCADLDRRRHEALARAVASAGDRDTAQLALEEERERTATLDAALARERDAVGRLTRDLEAERERTAAILQEREAAAHERDALSRAREADEAAHRTAIEALEQRWADLDGRHHEAVARADAAAGERDALRSALDAERERAAALDATLARERDAAAEQHGTAARLREDVERLQGEVVTHRANEEANRTAVEGLDRRYADLERQHNEALGRARDAAAERDALQIRLDEAQSRVSADAAHAEQRAKEAETRAEQARAERDELEARLTAAEKKLGAVDNLHDGLSRATEARLATIEQGQTRATAAWKEAEARADAAVRERDRLATELEAARREAKPDAKSVRLLKVAADRIKQLEFQLAERLQGPAEEVNLAEVAADTPVIQQVGEHAIRFGFPTKTRIRIDREEGQLVDLSLTGAQAICATSPEVGKVVTVTLPSGTAPCFGQGRLMWARREPTPAGRPDRYRVGLMFTDVDQKAVDAFIKSHAIT